MSLFHSKYRIESARLPKWDYSSPGGYFVTICTMDRECLFGEITNNEMQLSEFGRIIYDEWRRTGLQRSDIRLDEFVVMPNHVHGIVRILSINDAHPNGPDVACCRDVARNVSTVCGDDQSIIMSAISPERGSLSEIVRSFKSASTKRINESRKSPGVPVWQPRLYDHIIRNNRELYAIRRYIRNNPAHWADDRNVIETQSTGRQ